MDRWRALFQGNPDWMLVERDNSVDQAPVFHGTAQVLGSGAGAEPHPRAGHPHGGGERVAQSGRLAAGVAPAADALERHRDDVRPRHVHHGSADRRRRGPLQQRPRPEERPELLQARQRRLGQTLAAPERRNDPGQHELFEQIRPRADDVAAEELAALLSFPAAITQRAVANDPNPPPRVGHYPQRS